MTRHLHAAFALRTLATTSVAAGAATGCSLPGADSGGGSGDAKQGPSFTVAAAGDILIRPELTVQDTGEAQDHRLVNVAEALRGDDGLSDVERAQYLLAFERTQGTMLNRGASKDGLKPLVGLPD